MKIVRHFSGGTGEWERTVPFGTTGEGALAFRPAKLSPMFEGFSPGESSRGNSREQIRLVLHFARSNCGRQMKVLARAPLPHHTLE